MNNLLQGLGNTLISKVVVDKLRVPPKVTEKYEPLIQEVYPYVKAFQDFDVSSPWSYVKTVDKLYRKILQPPSTGTSPHSRIKSVLLSEGWVPLESTILEGILGGVFRPTIMTWFNGTAKEAAVYDGVRLWEVTTPSNVKVYAYRFVNNEMVCTDDGKDLVFFLPPLESEEQKMLLTDLREAFWANYPSSILRITDIHDFRQRGYGYTPVKFEILANSYIGPEIKFIDQWAKFKSLGQRRNVLLQGRPGTGKTTFIREACQKLGSRVLYIPSDCLQYESFRSRTTGIFETLQPDMVILEDIDRVGKSDLGQALHLFEDTYCKIPLVIATCNKPENIPEAMKRPGRFDQILNFNGPSEEGRLEIVKGLMAKHALAYEELPESTLTQALDLLKIHSPAYLDEYIKRVKVLGTEYEIDEGDLTFHKDS